VAQLGGLATSSMSMAGAVVADIVSPFDRTPVGATVWSRRFIPAVFHRSPARRL
jgi:hypothetical protein